MRPVRRALPDLAVALAAPVLVGLGWMSWAGAPSAYLVVNFAALLFALAAALWLPLPRNERGEFTLALACLGLIWLTALAGVEADGVRRWIALGPLRLHTGYLVLPLLVVLATRLPGWRAASLLVLAAIATLLQPDRAACYALAAATTLVALQRQDRASIAALVASLIASVLVLRRADTLAPVRFVETVQLDALSAHPLIGVLLTIMTFAPLMLLRGHGRLAQPLAAFMVVAGLCAFVGPYPSILIGFGAAPILGFGVAIRALRVH